MGCGMSAEERAERESSRAISKLQQEQADADSEAVKLLLLGAGESGKSTLFKQFRELYGKPLEQSELLDFKASIHSNVLVFMKALCEQATLGTFTNKCSAMEAIRAIEEADAQSLVDLELAAHIKKAWADAGVQVRVHHLCVTLLPSADCPSPPPAFSARCVCAAHVPTAATTGDVGAALLVSDHPEQCCLCR